MLIYIWVAQMNMVREALNSMALIMIGTIAGTAIIAAMESNNYGTNNYRSKGTYSPVAWFFFFVIMWAVAYPLYLYKRKYFGLADRLGAGILIMLIFLGSSYDLYSRIGKRKAERGIFEHSERATPKPDPEKLAQKSDGKPVGLYVQTPGDTTIITDGKDFRIKMSGLDMGAAFVTEQEAIDYVNMLHKLAHPTEGKNYQPVGEVAPKPNSEVDAQKASLALRKQNEDTVEKARLIAEAPHGEYVILGSDDSGCQHSYAPSSIQNAGDNPTMWTLASYKNVMQQENISYMSIKQKNEFDCPSKKLRKIGLIAYDAPTGNGNIVLSKYENAEFRSIDPGSIGESLWSIACQKK